MNQYLEQFINETKFKKFANTAIDFGCGKGYDVACLRHLGWKVTGVDLPEVDLNETYEHIRSVDLVYSNYVLPFIDKKEVFVDSLYKNLKKDGKLLVCTFSVKDKEFAPFDAGVTKEELEELFSNFKDIKVVEDRIYDNSYNHKHWHDLLILTAKK